jgi:hypothetical protein
LTGKRRRLRFVVSVGPGGAALARVAVSLPHGLNLSRSAFPRGVAARVGSVVLGRSAFALAGGLSVALGKGGRAVTITVGAPTLRLAGSLLSSLRHHRRVALAFGLTIHDVRGKQTKLRLALTA